MKQHVSIVYTNYKGETATRYIEPKRLWFGATEYHPEPQWLLDAYDLQKQADRTFAMKDIQVWSEAGGEAGKLMNKCLEY